MPNLISGGRIFNPRRKRTSYSRVCLSNPWNKREGYSKAHVSKDSLGFYLHSIIILLKIILQGVNFHRRSDASLPELRYQIKCRGYQIKQRMYQIKSKRYLISSQHHYINLITFSHKTLLPVYGQYLFNKVVSLVLMPVIRNWFEHIIYIRTDTDTMLMFTI